MRELPEEEKKSFNERERKKKEGAIIHQKNIRSDRPAGREKCKNTKLRLKIKIYNNKV